VVLDFDGIAGAQSPPDEFEREGEMTIRPLRSIVAEV